ncbi:CoA-transferase family III [Cribrihabitans marinus]|uniref:CoA-transferase family III n=1 Tax=Cribrihabitans marinus TaxID=1227549 RepID=A0A1H7DGI9_9RHOB|nr:CoA transferase [Cribrihabitans marinus]GGH39200.1 CoA-transferase [Cribrihabitans marinus]SEK00816.1 CoA-transferase family III [Cribrihabitans marinus]
MRAEIETAFGAGAYRVTGQGAWRSRFGVTGLAVASMGAVGAAVADLIAALGLGDRPEVSVDRRLASLWFGWSLHPQGWPMPSLWDAVAGDYRGRDGWIRLHTNAPHHREAALSVLGVKAERDQVAAAVRRWDVDALEQAVVAAGGAAAAMRSRAAWLAHPQGAAVAAEPLVAWRAAHGTLRAWPATRERPLAGLRVLDLTRVLAGPVATRTLAGFGADVLRIDPRDWTEPGVIPEVTPGKRCAHLDLKSPDGVARFEDLLSRADVLVHGYRPGALDGLIDPARRAELAPATIEVSLCAYGWSGPWSGRRGFDSLVQMSSGIGEAGMGWAGSDRPHPLPVQALDHATGYFMAAAVLSALARAVEGHVPHRARLSLARTAELLVGMDRDDADPVISGSDKGDLAPEPEQTDWGPALRLRPAIAVAGCPMRWDRPASQLGSAPAEWP